MDRSGRHTGRGRCGHAAFPVEVLPVAGGKKIAYCLGCGRSGPVCGSSAEALAALREAWPPALSGPTRTARDLARGGVSQPGA